jgi:signal peptidase II
MTWSKRARAFWPLLVVVVLADCTSKNLADTYLQPEHVPHAVVGDVVRFTLSHNPNAAMSVHLGPFTRPLVSIVVVSVLLVLVRLYRAAPPDARLRGAALALLIGGALGNLGARWVSPAGVVDFIDIGLGTWRFFTFNVADAAVACGALLWWRDVASVASAGAGVTRSGAQRT